jgi:Ca2+-binding EF-hand superfamily protein
LDSIKKGLASRSDFNLIDAFKFFDLENKGWINSLEFYNGLQSIGIIVSTSDVMYFVKKYDKNESGRLRYSDFCDALIPIDTTSANKLCKRQPKPGDSYFT